MYLPIEVRDWSKIIFIEKIDEIIVKEKKYKPERIFAIFLVFLICFSVTALLISNKFYYVIMLLFVPIILFLTRNSFYFDNLISFKKRNESNSISSFNNLIICHFWQIDLVAKTDSYRSALGIQLIDKSLLIFQSPDTVPLRGQELWMKIASALKVSFYYSLVDDEKKFTQELRNYLGNGI